tara:strand:+ start:9450 stop:10415 length:966 start_codon:yes stop_codon:yes gene_type:complete
MAITAGTFTTHTSVGNREDLSDVIHDITPMDFPLMSNIERGTCSATYFEWQTDTLAAATAANAAVEGDQATAGSSVATSRFGNRTQIATKTARVTGTLRSIDTAGRNDELSYQVSRRARELKRDVEMTLCGTQVATAGSFVSARACAGLAGWLFDNQTVTTGNTTATTPAVLSGPPVTGQTAGTAAAFVSSNLSDNIALCWTEGGDPRMILMDAANKRIASGFTGIATQYRDNPQAGPATLIGAADVWISDFGQHSLIASRFVPTDLVYVLDTEQLAVKYLRPMQTNPLAKTGDADQVQLLCEFTLQVKEPKAHGKIYTTT